MRRRRVLVLIGVVVVAVVAAGAALLLRPEDPRLARGRLIDWGHYDRIEVGMSQEDVEAILGAPPGLYVTGPIPIFDDAPPRPGNHWVEWAGDHGGIRVQLDRQGAVTLKQFAGWDRAPPPTLVGQVRAWLSRLWP